MDWVRLLTTFHDHPKTLSVGNAGAGLYARSLAYCGDHETDGAVPREWVEQAVAREGHHDLPAELVSAGLWAETDSGYDVRDFLEINKSAEEMADLRSKRAKAGRASVRTRRKQAKNRRSTKQGTSVQHGDLSNSLSSSTSSTKDNNGQSPSRSVAREPRSVNRRRVTDAEHDLADQVLAAFNEAAGTSLAAAGHKRPIIGRIRERPDLTVDDHRQVIADNFASPWWSDRPGVEVIYGSAEQFERALGRRKVTPIGTRRPDYSAYDARVKAG